MGRTHNFQLSPRSRFVALATLAVATVAAASTLAAGIFGSAEFENGTVNSPATVASDSAASGGKAVVFGTVPAPQPPPPNPIPPNNPTPPASSYKKLTPGTSWQWQISGTINETILDGISNPKKMYDIDLFDTPKETISRLKSKNIVVICYFSAGSSENWRSDFSKIPTSLQGKNLDDWPGEKWLDVRKIDTLRPIMGARMDIATQKGCDGVEPDNVDGYTNDTGFPLSSADQLSYNRMLAREAHARNLSVGLKNDVDQISQLAGDFDWALNEQCYQYNECAAYKAFIDQNKAVFGVEYQGNTATFCPKANNSNYDWLKKTASLGATPRTACRNG